MEKNFKKVRRIIEKYNNFLLTTHLMPDGDAIGSELALAEYLNKKGKKTTIINHSCTPDYLEFLDEKKQIKIFRDNVEGYSELIKDAEVIILVDTNEFSRIKSMESHIIDSKAVKVCIDHHQDLDISKFDAYISEIDYPATSQILYDFISEDKMFSIDKYTATNLYAGIMTDTGSFRYPRTDSKTFSICSDLIRRGADPVQIFDVIYSSSPKNKVLLLARFINSFKFYYNDRLAIGTVKHSDFGEFGLDVQDVEGFSSFIMTIRNVVIGIVIVELKDSKKVSLRSKGEININELAKQIGGGGHKNAAGASVSNMSMNELEDFIIKNSEKFLNRNYN